MNAPTGFIAQMLSVTIAVLLFVMTIAFVSIPYTLGQNPGDQNTQTTVTRHLT